MRKEAAPLPRCDDRDIRAADSEMRTITKSRFDIQPPAFARPLALHIIPPHTSGSGKQKQQRDQEVTLEAAMQSLVLDKRHPVALELAGTAERRSFIVRATSQVALDHVEALLRSQYPQLGVQPLPPYEDPFRLLGPNEDVSAVELVAGAAPYLPLRSWQDPKQKSQGEADPLLGLLATLSKLPDGIRAVAQIGLVPAPPNWSKPYLRKSIEDALDPEKRRLQVDMSAARDATQATNWAVSKAPWESLSTPVILILGVMIGLLALVQCWIPAWFGEALQKLFHGQDPHLSGGQIFQIIASIVGILLVCILIYIATERVRQLFQGEMYDTKLVSEKTSRMAYRVRIRLYAIGPASRLAGRHNGETSTEGGQNNVNPWQQLQSERALTETRQEVLLRLIAAYRQFHLASGAYFLPRQLSASMARRLVSSELKRPGYGWDQGLASSRHLIGVDALAALWHMPSSSVLPELALVEHRRSRTLLMSPELARLSEGYPTVGYSEHGGYRLPFALNPQFFTLHTLIGGKSGEGKSTFMEHIAHDAMAQGGLVLIDPHGDLCAHALQAVPDHRADDVVLIDLSDPAASTGINPLDVMLGRNRDKAISDLLKTLSKIWEEAWGPRMENAFEMALRTLFEANRVLVAQDAQEGPQMQYTILDVLPILTNENFCHAILQQIQDDYLHRWWREYYEPMTLMQQRDVVIPVLSKVAKFEGIIARRILGQSVSTVNFTELIAERKIILLKLAKGVVGADVAAIVGATLLGLIQLTLEEQGNKALEERVRLPIIIDEFQTIAGADYGALAELRKYGATFFLATQSLEYLQKLDEVLLPLVLANVKQLVIFHMSAQDAETLCEELGVEQDDITNLDMYTCYVKLASSARRQPTFSLSVSPPPKGEGTMAESIRTRCRVRYTCSVDVIDERLREAMVRSLRLAPPPTPKGKKRRNASSTVLPTGALDPANGGTVIQLPAATNSLTQPAPQPPDDPAEDVTPPAAEAETGTEQRRRSRGRRGTRRGNKKSKQAARGGTTALAFSDDFEDGPAPDNELALAHLNAPAEQGDGNDRAH
jgi:DNA helicase HerA-like ATPase